MSPVRSRPEPPDKFTCYISESSLAVERNLAKVEVAGSIPVSRSIINITVVAALIGLMAEWLRSGLQNRVPRFNSGSGLHKNICPGGGIGIRDGLKIRWLRSCGFESRPGHQKRPLLNSRGLFL